MKGEQCATGRQLDGNFRSAAGVHDMAIAIHRLVPARVCLYPAIAAIDGYVAHHYFADARAQYS